MANSTLQPPRLKQIPHETKAHGVILKDPYFWFRNKENPEVLKHLKKENEYLEGLLTPQKKLRKNLFQELKARIVENESSVPQKKDDYFYYFRYEKGKQYKIHCRKYKSLKQKEEVILDVNKLAQKKSFISLGNFETSPDHRYLAYSTNFDGSEKYTIYIKDLKTGKLLKDKIENTYYSLAWFNDNQSFLYTVLDENLRPYKVFKHMLGSSSKKDVEIYQEKSSEMFAYVDRARSGKYLFIYLSGAITSEERFLDANNPNSKPVLIQERKRGHEYSASHHGEYFFILTNDKHPNFRVVKTPVSQPSQENWKEVIAPSNTVYIEDIHLFQDYLVVYERKDALTHIRIIRMSEPSEHYVQVEEPVYVLSISENPEFKTSTLRYVLVSPITPGKTYDYDMNTKKQELKKEKQVPTYKREKYQTERIMVKSWDGEEVPVDLLYKKGLKKNGKNPLYLYGYGSYGASSDPGFVTNIISLIDRGFIFALAHIRGGAEKGRLWYENGKFLKKKNTFKDFISSAEALIEKGYTNQGNIVISGGSAGGLLVGATLNMKPELFKAVVAHVPFVDVLNTMLDDTLPLTQMEYDEWGNPQNKEYFEYIKSYSPYDNLFQGKYPHVFATGGLQDPRVCYWEPAKWLAKMRDLKTDQNYQVLYTHLDSGHGGASGRYDYLKEVALEYAFVLKVFGLSSSK